MESNIRKRILLGQLGSNGDCLHATVLARQIKHDYPNCHLTWAIGSIYRSIIENNPFIDRIWEIPATNWEEIVAAWNWLEQEVKILVERGEFDEIFMTQVKPNNQQNYDGTTRVSLYRGYSKPITVPLQNILRLRDDEIERVQNFAQQHHLTEYRHVILFECTSRSMQSFVTPEYALHVAHTLLARVPDCCIILSSNIKIPSSDQRIIDGSDLSLRENAELTKYCSLFIGCSSGITQVVLTDWAKPLPIIQLLKGFTSVYASIAHDLEYWKLPSDHVLEMTDTPPERLIECVSAAILYGFSEAHRHFHQQIRPDFTFYLAQIRGDVLYRGDYAKAAQAILYTVKRYGWHPQLKAFIQNEFIPKAGLQITLPTSDEACRKTLEDVVFSYQNSQRQYMEKKDIYKPYSFPKIHSAISDVNRPFWSVMLPTYKKLKYLEQTLRSVLVQALSPDEMQIEVVNDCPDPAIQDEMEALVKSVGQGRVQFYRHPQLDIGQAAIFNVCIERAQGQWVHILHDDDIVLPSFYKKIREGIEKEPTVGMAFSRYFFMDENNNGRSLTFLEKETPGIIEDWLERIAVSCRIHFPGTVVKRSVYEHVGGFCLEMIDAADWEMWIRIAAAGYKVWYEPEPLAAWRQHTTSLSAKVIKSGQQLSSVRKVIELSHSYLPKEIANELSEKSREYYARYGLGTVRQMLSEGDAEAVINNIREVLKINESPQTINAVISLLKQPNDNSAGYDNTDINRRQLADSWLKVPSEFLEKAYSGDMGNAHRRLIESNLRNEPLTQEENAFLQMVITELTKRSATDPASAINYLLAAMLYLPSDRLKIENARESLPKWLIGDYERFFGVVG